MVSAPQNDASLPARPKTMDDTSAPDVTGAAVTRPGNVDACRHGTTGTHERRSISGETVPQARIDSAAQLDSLQTARRSSRASAVTGRAVCNESSCAAESMRACGTVSPLMHGD